MAFGIRLLGTAALTGKTTTGQVTSAYSVPAGALLALVGISSGGGAAEISRLVSVADSVSNTWGNVNNALDDDGYWAPPNAFGALAHNVSAGTPTVTATFYNNGSSDNKYSMALLEITDAPTSGALEVVRVVSNETGSPLAVPGTGTLSQPANMLIAVYGGWIGTPNNPSGWSSDFTRTNGIDGVIGCQVSHKQIDTTASQSVTFTGDGSSGASALLFVIKKKAESALRYKFQLDDSTFTSSDTNIIGEVWRNSTPSSGVAEHYTGLTGAATDGDLYITSIPAGASVSDTVYGIFYNSTDTSGLIQGVVEVAS